MITRVGRDETPEQALERRLKESQRVDDRVSFIYDCDEFHRELAKNGQNLLVVEVGPLLATALAHRASSRGLSPSTWPHAGAAGPFTGDP